MSGVSSSFASHINAAEKEKLPSHLQSQSNVVQSVVPDNMVEFLDSTPALDARQISTTADSFDQRGRVSSSRQVCGSDVGEVDTDVVTRNMASGRQCDNTPSQCRPGRGRGLLSFRQLQAAKMSSTRMPGKSSGSAGFSSGSSHGVDSFAPGMKWSDSAADADAVESLASSHDMVHSTPSPDQHLVMASGTSVGVVRDSGLPGGCLNAISNSECGSQGSAVHEDPYKSSSVECSVSSNVSRPPGITDPAPLPTTCPVPMTSYHPHMMPFSWPPPPHMLCGVVPPGFASPAMPVPMPYSSLPVYPAYGYHMMPSSWPFLSTALDSLPADKNNDSFDKVD